MSGEMVALSMTTLLDISRFIFSGHLLNFRTFYEGVAASSQDVCNGLMGSKAQRVLLGF